MSKLTKMQISRLEEELCKKINTQCEAIPAVDNTALTAANKNINQSKKGLERVVLKAYNKRMGTNHTKFSNIDYYDRYHDITHIAKFMGLPEYDAIAKAEKARDKIKAAFDKKVKIRTEKIDTLHSKLYIKKESIMNDAYFRDAEFALEALDNF